MSMIAAAMLATSSLAAAAPQEPTASSLRAAIWYDLQVNAMIGNDNWIGSLWYNAGSGTEKDLHLSDLTCSGGTSRKKCVFSLVRDGGLKTVLGDQAPAELSCSATLKAVDDGEWAVVHTPPKKAGHSRTTMRCRSTAS
jgi:hypothetical protein